MFRRKKIADSSTEFHAPDGLEMIDITDVESETSALNTISRLFDVYQPGVVFGEPTSVGDHTVITAAEVHVGMGLGFGRGAGGDEEGSSGEGAGGGGGGGSAGRPVAAIIIGPDGVQVEPIVDVTKLALAFFTMLGAMFMTWRAMRRQMK